MVMPPQKRLGLSCAGWGSAGFSSLVAGAGVAIAAGAVSVIDSGAVSGTAFAEVSGACNESVAVVGSYDVIA